MNIFRKTYGLSRARPIKSDMRIYPFDALTRFDECRTGAPCIR